MASPALALNFNAFWLYRQAGGEDIDTRNEFQQRYSLGVGPSVTYRPTHAIALSASVGYTRTHRDQGQGMTTTEEVTPSAQLSLINDIFLAQISGSGSSRNDGSGFEGSNRSWDATLGSRWDIPFWRNLRGNYGERTSSDSSTKEKYTSATIDWDLMLAKLYYLYNKNWEEDGGNSLSENESHFGRLETGGRFWNKRIAMQFVQQYQTSTRTIGVGDLGEGDFSEVGLDGQTLAAVLDAGTDTEIPENLEGDILLSAPQLSDDIRDRSALVVAPGQRVYLGVDFEFEQQIDILRITLDPLAPLTEAQAAALHWSVYVRNPFNTGWDLAAADIPASYDRLQNRLELSVHRTDRRIMVVAVNPIDSGISLTLTELEAVSLLSEDSSSSSTTYLTNLQTSVRLTRTLSASGGLMFERIESEFGKNSSTDDRRTVNGSLRWIPVPFISPALGYNESRESLTGEPDLLNRSYSLTVSTIPLPTTSVTFGATHTERFQGDRKTDSSNRYNLISNAQIYPDLNASWFLSYRTHEILNSDDQFKNRHSWDSRLDLNARIYRALTADLSSNYRNSESDDTDSQFADATLSLLYRPSDLLALRGAYTTVFVGADSPDQWTLGLDAALVRTLKTRLDLRLTHTQADKRVDTIALNGSWNINRNLSLLTRANYALAEVYSYSFYTSLMLRL